MRKTFLAILLVGSLLSLSGVVVFHFGHGLSWLDSVYFVITIITTVGFGDFSLRDAQTWVKVFGCVLMLTSAAIMAAMFGIITDRVLQWRLDALFGRRRIRMQDHIVLCGLGHVGIRVLEQLCKVGEKVVVIEAAETARYLDDARKLNVPIIVGDMRTRNILERARVNAARSLIAATGDDLVNLEAALAARELRPDIRVVLRIFDHSLAGKIATGFGIKTTFSTAALAAPAFAMAAVDPSVVGSFYVGEDLLLVVQLVVDRGARLDGMTLGQLAAKSDLAVLSYEAAVSSRRSMHPAESQLLGPGDRIVVSTAPAALPGLKELNACETP
jgi:Trk K+ transport system NAD-binding subunit